MDAAGVAFCVAREFGFVMSQNAANEEDKQQPQDYRAWN